MNTTVNKVTATLTDKGLSLIVNGRPHVVGTSHLNYTKIVDALRAKDNDKVVALLEVAKAISEYTEGHVTIEHGVVKFRGQPLHNTLTTRMISMLRQGLDVSPMAKFLNNLMKNPSFRSVDQLYNFMEACDMPITADGRLLVYRSVMDNYYDQHTKKSTFSKPAALMTDMEKASMPYRYGPCTSELVRKPNGDIVTRVSMDRNQVNDNPEQTCSNGLHVCSQSYGHFSQRLLLCVVDPADVVSVPVDYNAAKMRVSAYEVIDDVQEEGFKTFEDAPVYDYDTDEYNSDDVDDNWF